MKLIRYQTSPLLEPVSRWGAFPSDLDQLFDFAFPAFGGQNRDFLLNLYQDREALVAQAELPGYRKEDISVEVTDGVLTLTAHRRVDTDTKDQAAATQEERQTRSVQLPNEVDVDKIQARYENGVLTVTLPKREEAKPKQITIDVK